MEQIDNRADRRDADYPPRCRSHWSASPPQMPGRRAVAGCCRMETRL